MKISKSRKRGSGPALASRHWPWRWSLALMALASALVVIVLLVVRDGDDERGGSTLPCVHFRSVAGQVLGGSLSAEDVRRTFAEIESQTTGATRDVKRAAQRMLALAGEDDLNELIAASQEMATACAEAGH